jgi:hypothetical protein
MSKQLTSDIKMFSVRIPTKLLARFEATVEKAAPKYHNVSHAAIIALTDFCDKHDLKPK